ncbi:MAG: Na/Pi symporter, partial [bacterium]|nr:Na/Pi symporter [bacterium]
SQGFISLEAGIALTFGANIGTCVTAILAAIGKPREAIRAGVIHVVFKVVGVALWFFFISQFADVVRALSPRSTDLEGIARLAAETPRQIANAHTLFNVVNTLLFIGFTGPFARLVRRLVPDKQETQPSLPTYLNTDLLQTPDLAFDLIRMELGRQGAGVVEMVHNTHDAVIKGYQEDLNRLKQMDNRVDAFHGALVTYLGQLSQESLSQQQSERLHDYMAAANYMENIGDIIETNLVEVGQNRLRHNVHISPSTQDVIRPWRRKSPGPWKNRSSPSSVQTGPWPRKLNTPKRRSTSSPTGPNGISPFG